VKVRDVIHMLEQDGWVLARTRGSHRQYKHPAKLKVVRVEVMKEYLVVIERTRTGFSAYSPDLPGCVSTGATRPEVEQNISEAIAFHLDTLRNEGQSTPR
jgi:predicted RNase H-like HicB family nuclease